MDALRRRASSIRSTSCDGRNGLTRYSCTTSGPSSGITAGRASPDRNTTGGRAAPYCAAMRLTVSNPSQGTISTSMTITSMCSAARTSSARGPLPAGHTS